MIGVGEAVSHTRGDRSRAAGEAQRGGPPDAAAAPLYPCSAIRLAGSAYGSVVGGVIARRPSTRRLYIEKAEAMQTASWTSPSVAPALVAASTSAATRSSGLRRTT